MANQKAISVRVDEELLNMTRDYATIHGLTTNRLINRALEYYILYQQYRDSSASELMTFDDYYNRKEKHAHRPSRWVW